MPHFRRAALPLLALTLSALVLGNGCGEKPTTLQIIELDFVAEIPADEVQEIEIRDPERPLDQADVLHLGTTGIEAASMLMTFDFSALAHPDSAYLLPFLVPENIRNVDLKLQALEWYMPTDTMMSDPYRRPWPGLNKVFEIHELVSVLGDWPRPGLEPEFLAPNLCLDTDVEPLVDRARSDLDPDALAGWIGARQAVGLIVREGAGSDPGIEGFASVGLREHHVLHDYWYTETIGPVIRVQLDETPSSWPASRQYFLMKATWDATTWHRVPDIAAPDADFVMAGQLGRMHVLRFTLPDTLPLERIYSAELVLTTAPDTSVGPRIPIYCHNVTRSMADSAAATWRLDDLAAAVGGYKGRVVFPEHPDQQVLSVDITPKILGLAAGREHRLAYMFGGNEPRLGTRSGSRTWQFIYTRPVIRGLGRPLDQAPRLNLVFRR